MKWLITSSKLPKYLFRQSYWSPLFSAYSFFFGKTNLSRQTIQGGLKLAKSMFLATRESQKHWCVFLKPLFFLPRQFYNHTFILYHQSLIFCLLLLLVRKICQAYLFKEAQKHDFGLPEKAKNTHDVFLRDPSLFLMPRLFWNHSLILY